jgi:hypothetical protein
MESSELGTLGSLLYDLGQRDVGLWGTPTHNIGDDSTR